jgi:preprotein translocase subunit SecF
MKHIKNLLLISLLISLASCFYLKKTESYYGIDTSKSTKYVFLIDISGSMEGKVEKNAAGEILTQTTSIVVNNVGNKVGGIAGNIIKKQAGNQLTKLGKAKKELMPAIRGLNENSFFTIICFENDLKMWRPKLIEASSTNKNLAIGYINRLQSGGGTYLRCS